MVRSINVEPRVLTSSKEHPDKTQGADTGLQCLVLLLSFHQVAADAGQLRHDLGKADPANADDLVRLAKRAGARAKRSKLSASEIASAPTPFIACDQQGAFFLVGGVKEDKVLLQAPGHPPSMIEMDEIAKTWTGEVVFVTTRASLGAGSSALSWFVPKNVLRLGAQFALAGPPHEITGRAEAISGDSLLIEDAYIRLEGLDASAVAQTCLDAHGVRHEVGCLAAARLAQLVYPGDVSCRSSPGHAGQGVLVAGCAVGGEDLGGRIIDEGWAWPVSSSGNYFKRARRARAEARGVWAMDCAHR